MSSRRTISQGRSGNVTISHTHSAPCRVTPTGSKKTADSAKEGIGNEYSKDVHDDFFQAYLLQGTVGLKNQPTNCEGT